jgi:hypothetical protein
VDDGKAIPESVWCELAFVAVAGTDRGHGLGTTLISAYQRALAAGRLGMMATIQAKSVDWYRECQVNG